ncbi:MAG: tRNA (adenosine(37)-N6)-dimethylallyltransferase MiaA, partial [Candidatus Pacebacteria bacterium]|nr:tRNA (adenosine(37)-N6)-dimethylallyltransferase MiaA [Candidatus Paceibacterota bacterium]
MKHKLIVILGPTAVGKTNIAVNLALRFNGEIISADSRQVYNRMDIGTGKDLDEYNINGIKIPYHLINLVEPTEEFNLFQFQQNFYDSFYKISESGKLPFLVGGTGLYIQSILKDYHLPKVKLNSNRVDELESKSLTDLREILKNKSSILHNTTDLKIKERVFKAILIAESDESSRVTPNIDFDSLVIGIEDVRDIIKQNITKRLKQRLNQGMVEEVKALIDEGISYDKL